MPHTYRAKERFASQMLLLATVFWGVSFPVMKSLTLVQQHLLPGGSSWFFASSGIAIRFASAAVVMLIFCWRSAKRLTWNEIWHGVGLGFFNTAGILLQVDGLAYTDASISAFLTQGSCVLIPLWVMLRDRRLPSVLTVVSCVVVVLGVAILARVDWRDFRLGRGEVETLLASIFFSAQILWLERPKFARNRVQNFSIVMFGSIALMTMPVVLWSMQQPRDLVVVLGSPLVAFFTGILVILCTLGAYVMMNKFQPHVSATKAGLIYCAEPVFASLFALVLPGWFSVLAAIGYPNEQLTTSLLVGGTLITLANILMQRERSEPTSVPCPNPKPHATN